MKSASPGANSSPPVVFWLAGALDEHAAVRSATMVLFGDELFAVFDQTLRRLLA